MEKKIPFFKKVIISIKDLDKYYLLISEKVIRSIIYLLEIMIIFALIVSGIMTYKTNNLIDEFSQYVVGNIPNFTIDKEGMKLENEGAYKIDNIENLDLKVILDDKAEDIDEYEQQIEEYDGNSILLLKNKMVVIVQGNKMETVYENFLSSNNIESITKNDIISLLNDNRVQINSIIYISIFGVIYFLFTSTTFIDALALSLLVIIISKMAKISIKYSQALTIGISSLTLPIILNLIYTSTNLLNGFYMEHFQIMYAIISYIYVVAVILIMRSDLIKKKQLIKATIEIRELEKNMESREDKEDKEENKDKKDKDNNKEKNDKESKNKLDDAKRKPNKKEGPEPQANIEGGK